MSHHTINVRTVTHVKSEETNCNTFVNCVKLSIKVLYVHMFFLLQILLEFLKKVPVSIWQTGEEIKYCYGLRYSP